MRNFMKLTPVSGIEIEPWGVACILIKVNDGVFVCTCNAKSDEYNFSTRHAFFYYSRFKPLHQQKCCGDLIGNIAGANIFVLEDKYIETKKNLRYALIEFVCGLCHVEYFYKISQCQFIVIIYIYLFKYKWSGDNKNRNLA